MNVRMLLLGAILISLCGCCHYDKENKTLWGWGKYKDKDEEISSHSPIKDIVNVSGFKLD